MVSYKQKLVLGTAQFGMDYGINNSTGIISEDQVKKVLQEAYINGINKIDSAEEYGNCHNILGGVFREFPKLRFDISTKCSDFSKSFNLRDKVVRYLKDLNVSKLNTLMFHSCETFCQFDDSEGEIQKLKEEGLIGAIGVSVYTNDEIREVLSKRPVDCVQIPFNMFDNFSKRGEMLKRLKELNVETYTRSVFLQGLFFKDPKDKHYVVQKFREELIEIGALGVKFGYSIPEMALLYCLSQKNIDKVVIGVDSVDHLLENISLLNKRLPSELIGRIDEISVKSPEFLNPSIW